MKRNKPLQTRKALVTRAPLRAKSALESKKGPTTKKSLRARSKKMNKIYEERRVLVAEMVDAFPLCQVYWDENCFETAVDVHEVKPRSAGGKIVGDDPSNYITVCRYCHMQIDMYPEEAHSRGFRKWSWE